MTVSATQQLLQADSELARLSPAPYHLPIGPRAPVVAGAVSGMANGDWLFLGARDRVGVVLRGCTVSRLEDPAAGARPYKLAPTTDAPGARALHAIGAALASSRPALCVVGNASIASGAWHEALNTAAVSGAPVVFVIVRHAIGADAPVATQLAACPVAIAKAFGLTAVEAEATEDAVRQAVSAARTSGAPAVVSVTLGA